MMLYLPEKSYLDGSKTETVDGIFLGKHVRISPRQLGSVPTSVGMEVRRFNPEVHEVIDHPTADGKLPAPQSLIVE
jgi:hypothetical protein